LKDIGLQIATVAETHSARRISIEKLLAKQMNFGFPIVDALEMTTVGDDI
jgi:hypothetical protein